MASAHDRSTTDHDMIRAWAESNDAAPATVRDTAEDGPGVLTFDMRGHGAGEESLEHVGWDAWFDKFEESRLALVFQHQKASGEESTFFRLVDRDSVEDD